MGREDEGSDLWEWETPRGLFLCLKSSVVRNRLGHFPTCARRALPQSSAVLHRLLVVVGKVVVNFRQYCPEVVQHCVRASKNR